MKVFYFSMHSFHTGYPQCFILLFFCIFIEQKLHTKMLSFDNRDLQGEQLIEYALIVSGSENRTNFIKVYNQLVDASSILKFESSRKSQILNLLRFLYSFFPLSYDYYQTKMDILLDRGLYNCVSLSLLYTALLRELGFKAYLLGSFDHTRVAVKLSEKNWLLVETTDKNIETWEQTSKLEEELLTDNQALALILRNLLFIAQEERQNLQIFLKLQTDLAELSGLKEDYDNLFELQIAYSLEKYTTGGIFEVIDFLDQCIEIYQAERLKQVRSKFIYNEIVTKFNNNQFVESKHLYDLLSLKMLPEHLRKIRYLLNYFK